MRRSLALAGVLSLVLAVGAWWLASQKGPSGVNPSPSRTPTRLLATQSAVHSLPSASPGPSPSPTAFILSAAFASPTGPAAEVESEPGATPILLPVILAPAPTATPPPTATPGPVFPPGGGDWRATLSYYRAVAHLPPLAENAAWSDGAFKHARYLVENDLNTSGENSALAWSTSEGAAAGQNSLWQVRGEANWNDTQTFDNWMRWPFHALSLIDPALQSFGYGRYSEAGADPGPFHTGAVLDVQRGLAQPGAAYPVRWPDHNTSVYLTTYDGGEQPDPLTSCSGIGLNGPAGLPILLQLGAGDVIGPNTPRPVVTTHSFKENGAEREHCLFDETTYQNSIASLRDQGRALLATRDAIVLIPRAPLVVGKTYTVSITAYGQTHTWTFRVVNKP